MDQNALKKQVAEAALRYVPEGEVVGVGTGSTANFFIDGLAGMKNHIAGAVASSEATAERLRGHGIPVLTILLGASMYLQQKLSPQAADPMQQRIMMLMPLIFTVMFVSFPAGLTIYWLTNNLITIAQQWWMLRGAPATPPKPAT